MTDFSTSWPTTILVATAFHFLTALGFSYVLPYLTPEPKIADIAEFEWIDVDLSDDVSAVVDADAIPTESITENSSPFNAQDLSFAATEIPAFPAVEIPPTPPKPELKPVERPRPLPTEQKISDRPQPPPTEPKSSDENVDENRKLMTPPVTLTEVYPEKGGGLGFTGIVLFSATIGTDGKVKEAELVQSSGRLFVDEIARKAVMQWTFRPALDQFNHPTACVKIIGIDFKKSS